MKKSKVDQIIDNLVTLTKSEVKELCDRLLREHSVSLTISVPASKVGGTITEGFWLKEANDKLRIKKIGKSQPPTSPS